MKKLLALLSLAGIVCLSSCNTAIGFGRDVREVGQGLDNKAHGRDWNGNVQDSQGGGNLPAY